MSKAGALRDVMAFVADGAAPDDVVNVPAALLLTLQAAIRSDTEDATRATVDRANLGDVYTDAAGGLWRVVGLLSEPSVTMISMVTEGASATMTGGVTGAMWNGFKRLRRA